MNETLDRLKRLLAAPRAASAYGMDMRELRHNSILDFMLNPPTPPDFSIELLNQLLLSATKCNVSEAHKLSELMASMAYGDALAKFEQPFVTVHEPACGADGMILAFAKVMIDAKHNPAERLWVQCQDIDRTAALMCYPQLSLWNIPGVVVVGNTLSMETRGCFYTPAHYFGRWDDRLTVRRACEVMR